MEREDYIVQGKLVPLKLQRFLLTVARREGIEQINIGVIISVNSKIIISDKLRAFPHKQLESDDFEETLSILTKEIGLSSFSVRQYIGSFDYPTERGSMAKQYNFEIELSSPPKKLNQGFVFVNMENPPPEFLNPSEARMLMLVLERANNFK